MCITGAAQAIIAVLLGDLGRDAEAEPLLARAYAVRSEKLGATHPETVRAGQELATLYRATGNEQKAAAVEQAIK